MLFFCRYVAIDMYLLSASLLYVPMIVFNIKVPRLSRSHYKAGEREIKKMKLNIKKSSISYANIKIT